MVSFKAALAWNILLSSKRALPSRSHPGCSREPSPWVAVWLAFWDIDPEVSTRIRKRGLTVWAAAGSPASSNDPRPAASDAHVRIRLNIHPIGRVHHSPTIQVVG